MAARPVKPHPAIAALHRIADTLAKAPAQPARTAAPTAEQRARAARDEDHARTVSHARSIGRDVPQKGTEAYSTMQAEAAARAEHDYNHAQNRARDGR